MTDAADIAWFKKEFTASIQSAIKDTPFDLDMLTAIACQETGYIWSTLRRKGTPTASILALCVGDTLDNRSAFPISRADLETHPRGAEMFHIAHEALVDMASHIPGYRAASKQSDKFCHGYGIFQYDLQYFKINDAFFLDRQWHSFDICLEQCLSELKKCLKRLGWQAKVSLSEQEKAAIAIVYNCGSYKPALGLKQGHHDSSGYYGEKFFAFQRLAQTVQALGGEEVSVRLAANTAPLAPPTPPATNAATHVVAISTGMLNVRSTPGRDPVKPTINIVGALGAGHPVAALGPSPEGWTEIETTIRGAHIRGFVSSQFLEEIATPTPFILERPSISMPTGGITAVRLPVSGASDALRSKPANAHSLLEVGQPERSGSTPTELAANLAKIIEWLAVDDPMHMRYQPRGKATFCNIYAHDYCHLAGVYLPRVWWGGLAIEGLARGENVLPRYGVTIQEMRANDLFDWLRDFGMRFGWRQTGTLTKLQTEVNLGAIGLIIARRAENGSPGHVAMVVPETDGKRARRDVVGDVTAPLQSQAGSTNFSYGTGRTNWWKDAKFAESALWLHP